MELTENERRLLEGFNRLDEQNRASFIDFMYLLVKCPGFSKELQERTPPGAECPKWEVTAALVAEWMAKEFPNGAA